MPIEWDENIPPHERVVWENNNNNEERIWLVKGINKEGGTTSIIKEYFPTKKEAKKNMERLNGDGAVCYVCGPFKKDEKGQLSHCAPVNEKKKSRI
jgi:hypothetical protein